MTGNEVPSFDEVVEKIERRIARADGQGEIDSINTDKDEQDDAFERRSAAARDKLAAIRAAMDAESGSHGAVGSPGDVE